ncbi:MAG: hypothetical protein NVSMB46_06390 [Candidatus Saccharimonadales bacterium]
MISFLTQPSTQLLSETSSVKFIIVPAKDISNDDDFFSFFGLDRESYINKLDNISWLRRLEIGTSEVTVYENRNYNLHISVSSQLFKVNNFNDIDNQSTFLKSNLSHHPGFYDESKSPYNTFDIQSLFIKPEYGSGRKDTLIENVDNKYSGSRLYKNIGNLDLFYKADDKKIDIFTKPSANPILNNKELYFPNSEKVTTLISVPYSDQNNNLSLLLDSQIIPLTKKSASDFGRVNNYKQLGLYSFGENQITNNAFANSLRNNGVKDCDNYDKNGNVSYTFNSDSTIGKESFQLQATRHIACTDIKFKVYPKSKNMLSFDYKSTDSKIAGYYLTFNDKNKTVIKDTLNIVSKDWNTLRRVIDVPADATNSTLVVYAYESDGKSSNNVLYDNVIFAQAKIKYSLNLPGIHDNYISVPVDLTSPSKFTLGIHDISSANLIENPSFEEGLWNTRVGDCDNHDKNGLIAQNLNFYSHTDGKASLQLEATKHIACTSKVINLLGVGDYNLSFDYLSSNAKQSGYNLQFNDPAKTVINQRPYISGKMWNHYNKIIKSPKGATSVTLTLYAFDSDEKTKNIVLYDNLYLNRIPELSNTYFIVTNPLKEMITPNITEFTSLSPTKHQVQFKEAKGTFLLSFAEAYDPSWKIYLNPIRNSRPCNQIASFEAIQEPSSMQPNRKVKQCQGPQHYIGKKDLVYLKNNSLFNDKHIKLNGFSNGWMIDPQYVKDHFTSDYYTINSDGSLNFNATIYYKPQTFVFIGFIISSLSGLACAGLITFTLLKNKKN